MTDDIKELLTLAAKACGYEAQPHLNFANEWVEGRSKTYIKTKFGTFKPWRPHLDDGDGARMEEKLGIEFEWHGVGVASSAYPAGGLPRSWREPVVRVREAYADHNNDRQAARRWASLRAAAQIGRQMP
jgi:hypothetical protein